MPFHVTQAYLAPGSVILPGNYGRVVRAAGYGHSHAMRESVLEHVRAAEFPTAPSRLDSAFFFETLDQARLYQETQGMQFVNVYDIEIVDPNQPSATMDHRRVTPVGGIGLDWARAYWAGDPMPNVNGQDPALFRETLTLSGLRIVRLLDPF